MQTGNVKPDKRDKRQAGSRPPGQRPTTACDPRSPDSRKPDPRLSSSLDAVNREIARLAAELEEERKKREAAERSLQAAKREIENTNGCLEEAFGKANQMALKAQIANIELNQIFNSSADGMWVIDKDLRILRINDTLLSLLQRERTGTVGEKCHAVFPGPHCQTPNCPLTRLSLGEKGLEFDLELDLADGTRKFLLASAVPFHGVDGKLFGIVEAYRDITDRKQAEKAIQKANEELQRLAAIDGLTEIANRRRFDECLRTEWRRMAREQKTLSLILCDLDFFKLYNDTYGHLAGDDCLRAVAQCVSGQLRRASDLAARYGGEEFVALLPDTDSAGALKIGEMILTGMAKLQIPHSRSAVAPYVTLSLGVTTIRPRPELPVDVLVNTADRALYEAKKQGRHRMVFLPEP